MIARGIRKIGVKREAPISSFVRLFSTKANGSSACIAETRNPLCMLKEFAESKYLCDEFGFTIPDKHWAFTIATMTPGSDFPILKTVNFQRVSSDGIDFVTRNTPGSTLFGEKVSFLYNQGKYKPGEKVNQWRADGTVQSIPLEWLLSHIPDHTICEMVATMRVMQEWNEPAKMNRLSISGQQSHFTEVIQQVRSDLSQRKITIDDLRNSIKAGRFVPENIERMQGGPDYIMWDRWAWNMENGKWKEPRQLMPF